MRGTVSQNRWQATGNQRRDTRLTEGAVNRNHSIDFLRGVDVVTADNPAKTTVLRRRQANFLTDLIVFLVITSSNKVHWQEVGIDTVLKFILRESSDQIQRHAVAELVLNVQRELLVLRVSTVEALGTATAFQSFVTTDRETITIGIGNALAKAREAKAHYGIHRRVGSRYQRPNAVYDCGAKRRYRSGTTRSQEIGIGVANTHTGGLRRLPLDTDSGNGLVRCRHVGVGRVGCIVVVVAVDRPVHHSETHREVVGQAGANMAFKVFAVIVFETGGDAACQPLANARRSGTNIHRTGQRVLTKENALGATQDFYLLEVKQAKTRLTAPAVVDTVNEHAD